MTIKKHERWQMQSHLLTPPHPMRGIFPCMTNHPQQTLSFPKKKKKRNALVQKGKANNQKEM